MLIRPLIVALITAIVLVLHYTAPGHCLKLTKLVKRTTGANVQEDTDEAGEGRLLASLIFPIFPQFYGVNYGDVLEMLTGPNLIASFIVQHLLTVSHFDEITMLEMRIWIDRFRER